MMKKMLVLALVLAVAGLANAALVETVLVPNALKAVVDTEGKTLEFVGTATAAGADLSITGFSANFQASEACTFAYLSGKPFLGTGFGPWLSTGNDWVGFAINADTTGTFGSIAKFSYDAVGLPTFTMYNDDVFGASEVAFRNAPTVNFGGTVDENGAITGGVTIVPEPMTMVLLGLGGLFLRKRK